MGDGVYFPLIIKKESDFREPEIKLTVSSINNMSHFNKFALALSRQFRVLENSHVLDTLYEFNNKITTGEHIKLVINRAIRLAPHLCRGDRHNSTAVSPRLMSDVDKH